MITLDRIHNVDALKGLRSLPDESIDCIMTSPPYWSARDYGIPPSVWRDGTAEVLGFEHRIEQYVEHLLEVMDEVNRVLKSTGTLWVNLGDTYGGSWGNYARQTKRASQTATPVQRRGYEGTPRRPPSSRVANGQRKSLGLIPERFALGMTDRGWICRNRIVWRKTNHLPSSVHDRLTPGWEHVFFFVKQRRYHFDLDQVRVPHRSSQAYSEKKLGASKRRSNHIRGHRLPPATNEPGGCHPLGKNPGDVWDLPTSSTGFRHTASYPERLCEIPVKAGCPPGGIVLDPFMGSGTTAVVATRFRRRFIGFELNPEFISMAEDRLEKLKGGGAT